MRKYYLAYGSNLNLKEMKRRCPTACQVGTINLYGYRLVYKGVADSYAYLTIEPCEDSFVPLGVYKLSSLDIHSLDIYEGYPSLYSKKYIDIRIMNKNKEALIYVMNDDFDYHLPSSEYIETCAKGYENFGFDNKILEKAYLDTYQNLNKPIIKKH